MKGSGYGGGFERPILGSLVHQAWQIIDTWKSSEAARASPSLSFAIAKSRLASLLLKITKDIKFYSIFSSIGLQ